MPIFIKLLFLFLISLSVSSLPASALEKPGENLKDIGLNTERGVKIDLSLEFTDSKGVKKPLKSFLLKNKPNIIVPAYYDCPRLCGLLLEGVRKMIDGKPDLAIGKDFNLITLSFNPEDTPEKAILRHGEYTKNWSEEYGDSSSWHFLVGEKDQISQLMESLGFLYKKDGKEFIHTAAIFAITPFGEISQYFADVRFSPKDVRLALVEAGKGAIGNVIDQALLFCFRFDPTKGKYTWAAFNVMRAGGGLTLLFMFSLFFWLRRKGPVDVELKE